MTTTLLQSDIAWGDWQENIRRVEAMMATENAASELYVLPEMWATGFATEPVGMAEEESSSAALEWMKQTANKRGCAISGSLAIRADDGTYRNRHYFVTPDSTVYYDKRHLFTHGHEDKAYTAGVGVRVAGWKGMRWLLQTCYDLRFPVFSRYGRDGVEYDGIIYVANWPEKRQEAWEVLTRARAIENQCYVVAVNRVGRDSHSTYAGGSMVIDPIGRVVCRANDGLAGAISAEISPEVLMKARQHFRVLADRDAVSLCGSALK